MAQTLYKSSGSQLCWLIGITEWRLKNQNASVYTPTLRILMYWPGAGPGHGSTGQEPLIRKQD